LNIVCLLLISAILVNTYGETALVLKFK